MNYNSYEGIYVDGQLTYDVLISRYMPEKFRTFINSVLPNIPDDYYLACPKYIQGSDIQIGGTGTVKSRERPIDALVRESKEEMSINPTLPLNPDVDGIWTMIYTLRFSVEDSPKLKYVPGGDSLLKVGFLYWASLEDWEYLKPSPNNKNEDGIETICFISKYDVIEILKLI